MARKAVTIFHRIEPILKYVYVGLSIALLTIAMQSEPGVIKESVVLAQTSQNQLLGYAQSLTNQGHELLNQGKAQEALEIWRQAELAYKKVADREGVTGSQINQSLALQALGQYRRACIVLLPVLKLDYQDNLLCKQRSETEQSNQEKIDALKKALVRQETSELEIIGMRILGDALRAIGNLEESQGILKQSLIVGDRLRSNPDIAANLLSLGNTERTLYITQKDLFYRTGLPRYQDDAVKKADRALQIYKQAAQQVTTTPKSPSTLLQAQLNQLSLLLEYRNWLEQESKSGKPTLKEKLSQIRPEVQLQVDELLKNQFIFPNLSPIQTIYARLNFAQSLIQLSDEKERNSSLAIQHAQEALQKAEELGNKRAKAYALGILGSLYEQTNKLPQAQDLMQKAVYIAQSIQAEDVAYQWQYELGKIYESAGNIKEAIAFYDAAVKTFDAVRQDLGTINTNLLFSFREKIEPIYRKLIRLYLEQPTEDNLKKALEVNRRFQLKEIENFLQCGLLDSTTLENVVKDLDNPPSAIIYTIVLEEQDRVEVIISLPKQSHSTLHHYTASWEQLKPKVHAVRDVLQSEILRPKDFEEISSDTQGIYNLLIAPAKTYLPLEGTLVFVLDSELQSIPLALLQDENGRYLIEDYSLTIKLGSQIRKPKSLPPKQIQALIAGVSDGPSFQPEFQKLEYVELELNEVKKNTVSQKIISEKDFTIETFQTEFNISSFPIIHLATHGQFSSDPEQTIVLTYNKRLNVKQLDRLLRSRTQASLDTIELLVLSACQTAKGDKRGSLGIAGVAVQAGARSTLASLWNVSDRSTAFFMKKFYQELKAGATKAEALRQAQIAFLRNPQQDPEYQEYYKQPYYWAAFILTGNWL